MHIDDARLPRTFWRYVVPEPMSGCWLWVGAIDRYGYASSRRLLPGDGGVIRTRSAHRVSFEAAHGPIKEPELDHLCCVRICVNPDHLEGVTHHENSRRRNLRRRTCLRGHPWTPENTYHRKVGEVTHRTCRACGCENTARYLTRLRLKAAGAAAAEAMVTP